MRAVLMAFQLRPRINGRSSATPSRARRLSRLPSRTTTRTIVGGFPRCRLTLATTTSNAQKSITRKILRGTRIYRSVPAFQSSRRQGRLKMQPFFVKPARVSECYMCLCVLFTCGCVCVLSHKNLDE